MVRTKQVHRTNVLRSRLCRATRAKHLQSHESHSPGHSAFGLCCQCLLTGRRRVLLDAATSTASESLEKLMQIIERPSCINRGFDPRSCSSHDVVFNTCSWRQRQLLADLGLKNAGRRWKPGRPLSSGANWRFLPDDATFHP